MMRDSINGLKTLYVTNIISGGLRLPIVRDEEYVYMPYGMAGQFEAYIAIPLEKITWLDKEKS